MRCSVATDPWPVHTVVYDLDDTLYLESEYVLSGFAEVDRWLVATEKITGFAGRARALFAGGLRGRVFDEALRELGASPRPELVREMVAVYRGHTPKLTPLPDALSSLQWARPMLRLALLTDGYHAVQQKKLSSLGMAAHFDVVVFTDALGRENWKPSPAGFSHLMQRLPGCAEGYLYVGDNPRKDFIAPRALGWKTIRIRRPGGEHFQCQAGAAEAADCEIASLGELRDLIVAAMDS